MSSEISQFAIVTDTHGEQTAFYVDGILRAEHSETLIDPADLMDCYQQFAHEGPVVMVHREIDSLEKGIWLDEAGFVDWPERLEDLRL